MKKRILSFSLVLILAVGFVPCGNAAAATPLNNTWDTAIALAVNTDVMGNLKQGSLSNPGVDWYAVTLTDTGTLQVQLVFEGWYPHTYTVRVYDREPPSNVNAPGKVNQTDFQLSNRANSAVGNNPNRIVGDAFQVSAGTYYVQISTTSLLCPVNDYTLRMIFTPGSTESDVPSAINITAMSVPASGGSVSGGGTFNQGDAVTLYAAPNNGFTFAGWFENGISVSTSANYAFTVSANRTLEARFVQGTDDGDLPFDNPHDDWAEEELIRAFEEGLFPPLLMDPNADLREPITRVEFAGIVVKTFENLSGTKVSPATANPFSDTKDVYALMAFDANLMVGTSATAFTPDMILNRETAATALTRVFKKWHFDGWTYATDSNFTLNYTRPASFADDQEISGWAYDSVYYMAANEIIRGFDGGTFRPKNMSAYQESVKYATATRQQALIMALRMVEKMK